MGYMSTKCQTLALLDCARKVSCQPKGRSATYYLFNFPQKLHKNEKEGRDTCYPPQKKSSNVYFASTDLVSTLFTFHMIVIDFNSFSKFNFKFEVICHF